MVLSSMPVGENDKRVILLTKERGRISAFARGARRPNSHLLAACTPFSFGEFEIYEGRSSYTIQRASIREFFEEMKVDLDYIWYGTFFLEVADYYAQENTDERERLKLLFQTFRAICSKKFSLPFIKAVYELKTIALNGEYPNVFSCMTCGKSEELVAFSMEERGCLCKECAVDQSDAVMVSPSVIYALQYVISSSVEKLFTFRLKPNLEEEFIQFIEEYRRRYFFHTYKSEAYIPNGNDS